MNNEVKLAISITNEYIMGWQSKRKWTARLRALGVRPVMHQECVAGLYAVPNGDNYLAFAKWCKKAYTNIGKDADPTAVEGLHIVMSATNNYFSPFFVAIKEE